MPIGSQARCRMGELCDSMVPLAFAAVFLVNAVALDIIGAAIMSSSKDTGIWIFLYASVFAGLSILLFWVFSVRYCQLKKRRAAAEEEMSND